MAKHKGIYDGEIYESRSTCYKKWAQMIDNCYSGKRPKYDGYSVCDEWLVYSKFRSWFNESGYEGASADWYFSISTLDNNARQYNPTSAVLVPKWVMDITRNEDGVAPKSGIVGVYIERNGKFYTIVQGHKVGYFDDPLEARAMYLAMKRAIVDSLRLKLNRIDKRLYPALISRYIVSSP